MDLLNSYFKLQKEIFEYFGYVEDWRVLPLNDERNSYWCIIGDEESGSVRFHEDKDILINSDGDYYENEIYTQRFLPKWVYRGEEYTMICVDTHCDGNKYLQIFSNNKEITEEYLEDLDDE